MSDDKDPQRISEAADNCEVLRARLAKYEDADGNPLAALKQPSAGVDERAAFESWRLEKFCGGAERLKKCSNASDVYYYTEVQEAWKVWQVRAQLAAPAGVDTVTADDVRGACQDAVDVFAEQPDADQFREVAEYMREVLLALIERRKAAAPSPAPASDNGEYGDPYQGAREDLAIWKRRALEAETKIREQDRIIDNLGNALNDENGPIFMGEPVLKPASDVVQVPRELIERTIKHLSNWLEMNDCECEGPGHYCGRTQVYADREQLRALLNGGRA
jgi:hypothetical protein